MGLQAEENVFWRIIKAPMCEVEAIAGRCLKTLQRALKPPVCVWKHWQSESLWKHCNTLRNLIDSFFLTRWHFVNLAVSSSRIRGSPSLFLTNIICEVVSLREFRSYIPRFTLTFNSYKKSGDNYLTQATSRLAIKAEDGLYSRSCCSWYHLKACWLLLLSTRNQV